MSVVSSTGAWSSSTFVSMYTCGLFLLRFSIFVSAVMYCRRIVYLWFVVWHSVGRWLIHVFLQWIQFFQLNTHSRLYCFIISVDGWFFIFEVWRQNACGNMPYSCVFSGIAWTRLWVSISFLGVLMVFGVANNYWKMERKGRFLRWVGAHADHAWLCDFICKLSINSFPSSSKISNNIGLSNAFSNSRGYSISSISSLIHCSNISCALFSRKSKSVW